jgi:hypothetical protein
MKILFIILCLPFLFSCSKTNEEEVCSFTVDSVSIIDSVNIKDNTYYLVYRVAGWSDKTEILELYDKKPVFDNCSKSNIEAIFGDSLELSKTISHVYLNIDENSFEVNYEEGISSENHNRSLKLEVR